MQGFDGMGWRPAWRMGDATMSPRQPRAYKRERGFTLIELVTAVGLIGIMLGVAMPYIPRGTYDLWGTQVQFLADMRAARTLALTKGDHYRLVVTSATHYEVRRMQLQGANWVDRVQPAIASRTLGTAITFVEGANNVYEFNTRGLLVNPGTVQSILLTDSRSGHYRGVTVWPSGQVAPDNDATPS